MVFVRNLNFWAGRPPAGDGRGDALLERAEAREEAEAAEEAEAGGRATVLADARSRKETN